MFCLAETGQKCFYEMEKNDFVKNVGENIPSRWLLIHETSIMYNTFRVYSSHFGKMASKMISMINPFAMWYWRSMNQQ